MNDLLEIIVLHIEKVILDYTQKWHISIIMHFVLCQAEATSRHEENLKQLIFVILCFNMHADYKRYKNSVDRSFKHIQFVVAVFSQSLLRRGGIVKDHEATEVGQLLRPGSEVEER